MRRFNFCHPAHAAEVMCAHHCVRCCPAHLSILFLSSPLPDESDSQLFEKMDSSFRQVIETGHSGVITDISVDSIGRKLASGSEDKTVLVWEIRDNGQLAKVATLAGHEGPIVQLAWAPLRSASHLVSCGVDRQLIVWCEISDKQWVKAYSKQLPSIPTSVAWAPAEYGPMFATSTTSGRVFVFSATANGKSTDMQWDITDFDAHANTCTSLSFAPALPPGSLCTMPLSQQLQQQQQQQPLVIPPQRLATVGNERSVKVWRFAPQDKHWIQEQLVKEELATSWVDVAWAPNVGMPFTYIAAGSSEGFVVIWSQDGLDGKWKSTVLPQFADRITRLSWSHVGTFLLVSCADNTATIWRETPIGEWEQQSVLTAK